ncbi:MAG: hypothetical protein IIY74_06685 [Firmicutes bacterium]|nr:hypothetical protein [Bacillota bacterium]
MKKDKTKEISKAGARMPGLAGAAFGAFFGAVPFAIVMAVLGSRGFYATPLALLVPISAATFYISMKGLRRIGWALGCTGFMSIFAVFNMYVIAQSHILSRTQACIDAAAGYGVAPLELAMDAVLRWENLKLLLPGILFTSLVVVAGLCFSWSRLSSYADLTKEGAAEIRAEETRAEEEKRQEQAKALAEKRKKLPGRLERFGADPDAPIRPTGEYTAAPYDMQKKYVSGLGIAVMIIFTVLAGFALYKGITAGRIRTCLLAAPSLIMVYEGLRIVRSIARRILVSGDRLTYVPAFGAKREFTFDDIGYVRKVEGRCLVDGRQGEGLAFFSLSWENGKRLLTAMEDYRIEIREEQPGASVRRAD